VNFGQTLRKRQTKTGSLMAPAKVVIDLAERLQCDARLIRVHTKAVVADHEFYGLRRCVLHR
jgi:hypothetical protein